MVRRTGRILAFILCLAAALTLVCPLCPSAHATAATADAAQETVRVAYFESMNFQEKGADDDIKSGYSYEIYQEIAKYTGWKYEYVYGDWADLFDKFKAGEIDLFAGLAYREEREPYMDWADRTIDLDYHSLFVRRDDPVASDKELSGKRIGVIRDNNMTREFLEWAEENGVEPQYVYYDSIDPLTDELENGTIDGFIGAENNIDRSRNVRCYVRYAETKSYICVRKGASDILRGLNYALEEIELNNPDFYSDLKIKYYSKTTTNATLSKGEQAWIEEHGVIRIGCLENYMPFCATDENGNVTGSISDITDSWLKELGIGDSLEVEFVVYPGHDELVEGLGGGEIDAAFPIVESAWNSESTGIMTSAGLFDLPMTVVFKGDYSDDIFDVMSVKSTGSVQEIYIKENYPDAGILYVDSADECLRAVLDGRASSSVMTNVRLAGHLTKSGFTNIHYIPLNGSMTYCFGVLKGNTDLLALINRGIGLMDKPAITAAMYGYVENFSTYGVKDFLYDNLKAVLLIAFVIILIIAGILSAYFRAIRKSGEIKAESLSKTQEQLKTIQDLNAKLEDQTRAAEHANQAKSQFLFNMSHDIRTPLNAIIGYTAMAKRQMDKSDVSYDYLNKIDISGHQLLSLINQVLEMSRIESGRIELAEDHVDLNEKTANLGVFTAANAGEKGINLTVQNGGITHGKVLVDISRVDQIVNNIVGNAIKYTPEGGSVDCRFEELPCEKDGWGLYRITVSDTGIGMSDEFLEHIYEEFAREKTSTVSRIQGTGLGMPIVKKLVDLMGGTIEIESKPGEGTSVAVTLPMKFDTESVKREAEEQDYHNISFEGKRLLLVEDNEMNREIAKDILEEAGFIVETAEDGDIAVEMLKKTAEREEYFYYNAVLMDIQMPRMDGYEATKLIRAVKTPEGIRMPIIALSANAFEEDKKKSLEAGMDDHIAKPINIQVLKETLAKYL